jgi:Family of unknown function (DUF5677)
VVNLAAHLLDEEGSVKGGWPRNQAIPCAGLMIRIAKFMLVVTQLSAEGNRAEGVSALNRSIMESAVNLEFLVSTNDDKYFDQFVRFSLGPERELYDIINANVTARGGEVVADRGTNVGVNRRCLSGVGRENRGSQSKVRGLGRRPRERLRALNKEEQYVGMQRMPSHAVHGNLGRLVQEPFGARF